jgi:hypothetical protein
VFRSLFVTDIVGDQLTGLSSADMYRRQLLQSCRHVEVTSQRPDCATRFGGVSLAPARGAVQLLTLHLDPTVADRLLGWTRLHVEWAWFTPSGHAWPQLLHD